MSRNTVLTISDVLLFMVLASFIFALHAAPRAGDRDECFMVTDMGITARAIAEEGAPAEVVLRVLTRMYPEALTTKWALALATTAANDKRPAKEFARALFQQCIQNGGNMDALLGTAL